MRIITHPKNIVALRQRLEREERKKQVRSAGAPWCSPFGFEITPDPNLDAEKETGRYILPDGRTVAREDLRLSTRWIEYGPEDVDWLIYAGIVQAEMEMVFYEINDDLMRFSLQHQYGPVVTNRRAIFNGFS